MVMKTDLSVVVLKIGVVMFTNERSSLKLVWVGSSSLTNLVRI